MNALRAARLLALARLRRHPARWMLIGAGVALACGFAGSFAVQSTVAADQTARRVLSGLSDLDRTVRVTWPGIVTPAVERQARGLLAGVGLKAPTEVALLNPVRLDGIVVRPAAVAPLPRWGVEPPGSVGPITRRCRPSSCPMLIAGGSVRARVLSTSGVRISIAGRVQLRSAAPLGFVPGRADTAPPLLLSGDPSGLDSLPGLAGVYRTRSWLKLVPAAGLHAWQLRAVERRLQRAQATLLASGSGFALTAPFAGLSAARAQAAAVPGRLLLNAGGAVAVLGLFVVLSAGALRREHEAELRRLRLAGARSAQAATFVLFEAALVSAAAVLAGAALALLAGAALAHGAGLPVGAVLRHSLLTFAAGAGLAGAWSGATLLIALPVLVGGRRLVELFAVAAVGAVALGLSSRGTDGGALPFLLAPLCCLAAGVLLTALGGPLLRGGERATRRAPPLLRLASVGLARAPSGPSLAIAFVAISVGLGGFALSYRATLLRGSSDEAAQRVPLGATISSGADFLSPLQLAPLSRWRSMVPGRIWPVRRTTASFVAGAGSVTVPALGVPAPALDQIDSWRPDELTAPVSSLARALSPSAFGRPWGVAIPAGIRSIAVPAGAPAVAVGATAIFSGADDAVVRVFLGQAGARRGLLRARLPRVLRSGSWRLAGLELDEPSGLEATNGHQNGENPAAATRFTSRVSIGPVSLLGSARPLATIAVGGWRGVGAAGRVSAAGGGAELRFATTGVPGLLRPAAPSDHLALPVLVDPATAAAAGRDGELALTVDGLPVTARIAGVLRRMPGVGAGAAGFVVADERSLASALDAQMPGQGRADELWITTPHPARLRTALARAPFDRLSSVFRIDVEHSLRDSPLARSLLGALFSTAGVCGGLAVLGLIAVVLGQARDPLVERDLHAQGIGPVALRRELRLRVLLGGGLGVLAGLGVAVLLGRLAVATVRAGVTGGVPDPPLLAVSPPGELMLLSAGIFVALGVATWGATHAAIGARGR